MDGIGEGRIRGSGIGAPQQLEELGVGKFRGAARAAIAAQMIRAGADPDRADAALSLATGALQAAAADADAERQAAILSAASTAVQEWL